MALKTVNLFLVGPGKVGMALLQKIETNSVFSLGNIDLRIKLGGVISRNKMFSIPQISPSGQLTGRAMPADIGTFLVWITRKSDGMSGDVRLLVDCTAGEDIIPYYARLLESGVSVVTPNKCANSGSMEQYKRIRTAAKSGRAQFLYEANVGGGLPVISTIQRLQEGGDKVTRVRGVFSGTLSFILNNLTGERTFVDVVKEAQLLGYTEPDPKQDLSGRDVARKALILAREMGADLEMSDVWVEDLNGWEGYKIARKNSVFRYISEVSCSGSQSRVYQVDSGDSCAQLTGAENCFEIFSQNYNENPLIIRGPGAGVEVTAASVLADILKVAGHV